MALLKLIAVITIIITACSRCEAKTHTECLAEVIYAESRGEPVSGAISVAEAAWRNAGKNICTTDKMQRHKVPVYLRNYYVAIAKVAITNKHPFTKKANSWNVGAVPALPGDIEMVVGKHVFYVMR